MPLLSYFNSLINNLRTLNLICSMNDVDVEDMSPHKFRGVFNSQYSSAFPSYYAWHIYDQTKMPSHSYNGIK